METKAVEKELTSYFGRLLRDHFSKGPGNIFVTVSETVVKVYFTQFLSPSEKILLSQGQEAYVHKTRDFLMNELLKEIKSHLRLNLGLDVEHIYYDWNLSAETGVFLAVGKNYSENELHPYKNQQQVNETIAEMTNELQKVPKFVGTRLLDKRTLLIVRDGLLIEIEKEMNRLGFEEYLRIAKRNVEKRHIEKYSPQFERLLQSQLTDYFVDWDFDRDRSVTLFILKPDTL